MSIKFSVFAQVKDYEKKLGRSVNVSELAQHVGVDIRTMSAAMRGDMQRVDLVVLSKLLAFFAAEGMPITVGDLFTVTDADK
jgi:hypothetical protein